MTVGGQGPEVPPQQQWAPPQQQWAPPPGAGMPAPGQDPGDVVGRRIGAALIDFIPLIALFVIVGVAFGEGESSDGNASISLEGGSALLYFALTLAYYVVCEATWGATLGKRALGLMVTRADGAGRASFGQVLGRNLLRIVDGFFFYAVGLIVMLATKRKQRVGDLAAGTLVVRRQAAAPPPAA